MLIEYLPKEEMRLAALTIVASGKRVRFEPGQNQIDDDTWNEIKSHSKVADRLKSGVFKVHSTIKAKTLPKDEPKTETPKA